jgi:hypothetical protein
MTSPPSEQKFGGFFRKRYATGPRRWTCSRNPSLQFLRHTGIFGRFVHDSRAACTPGHRWLGGVLVPHWRYCLQKKLVAQLCVVAASGLKLFDMTRVSAGTLGKFQSGVRSQRTWDSPYLSGRAIRAFPPPLREALLFSDPGTPVAILAMK